MFVVAGVSGHVGSVVAKELLAKGEKIRVIVRDAAKGAAWSSQGAEVAVGSLEDGAFLAGALKGAKGFFTLLPPNYQGDDFDARQTKTGDTIASAAKTAGVPHVVILSSIGADLASGNGPIRYVHHLEQALHAAGVKTTAIRAGSFQENVGNVLGAAKGAGIYPNFGTSADYPIAMIATRDIGALAAKSLLAPPAKSETVDLVGPSYTQQQVADKLGAALGKKLNVVNIPPEGWVAALEQAGLGKKAAEMMADMYTGFASGKIQPHGDRVEHGATPIDDVIKTLVG